MSSTRTLKLNFPWNDEVRAVELLDWETKPEDFDRLYDFVIDLYVTQTHSTREQLFSLIAEEDLRREVRFAAERFDERFTSLTMFIYMWLRFQALPRASHLKRERGES